MSAFLPRESGGYDGGVALPPKKKFEFPIFLLPEPMKSTSQKFGSPNFLQTFSFAVSMIIKSLRSKKIGFAFLLSTPRLRRTSKPRSYRTTAAILDRKPQDVQNNVPIGDLDIGARR